MLANTTHAGLTALMDEAIEYRGLIIKRGHAAQLEWDRERDMECVLDVLSKERVRDEPVTSLQEAIEYLSNLDAGLYVEAASHYSSRVEV